VQKLMTTDHVPAADRLAYFRETLMKNGFSTVAYGDPDADFWVRMDGGGLGSLTLLSLTSQSLWSRRGLQRGQDLIRRSNGSYYHLVLNLRSSTMIDHNEHQIELSPGDMALIDTSRPYDGFHESGMSRVLTVSFPRTLLPVSPKAADNLVGARLCGRVGIGALLRDYVLRSAKDLKDFSSADATRVSTTLLDLLGGLISHELELKDALSGEPKQRVLYQQIKAFIQQRLADPTLTPGTIAEAHHISVRTLHRLFGSHGHSVTEWIRTRRLDRCRRDLADPLLTDLPVSAIAARWGYHQAAHFTRLFRSYYEVTPSEYRRASQQPGDGLSGRLSRSIATERPQAGWGWTGLTGDRPDR
jgi:AraC-like DNA-binding protein